MDKKKMLIKDYNNNGVVDAEDLEMQGSILKLFGQTAIAWVSLLAIILFTVVLCTDFISLERVKALDGIITTLYVALSSLVGAHMGFTTWLKKN